MPPDPLIVLTLVAIIAGAGGVFWMGIRRETRHRARHRLEQWAEQNRFQAMNPEFGVPRPFNRVRAVAITMTLGLFNRETRFVHLRSAPLNPGDAPLHWNFAIRHLASASPPVGLRAVDAQRSVTDLFGLEASPHQASGNRFTIVGDDLIATRRLADGSSRALLPGDVSLLRIDDYLVLDFSGRPFDPIELGRMLAMLDQMASIA